MSTSLSLLRTLQARFETHPERHPGVTWQQVRQRLEARPAALASLQAMEETGGEPDVIRDTGPAGPDVVLLYVDCSPESPSGRRSLCYDRQALDDRKENKPRGSAAELAGTLGIELMTPDRYAALQAVGEFDLKTSSWLLTPPEVRALGGALFGDRRYGRVFTYHNGASSYYAARGFRGVLPL